MVTLARFTFSLRSLFVLFTAISIGVGIHAYHKNQLLYQRSVEDNILRLVRTSENDLPSNGIAPASCRSLASGAGTWVHFEHARAKSAASGSLASESGDVVGVSVVGAMQIDNAAGQSIDGSSVIIGEIARLTTLKTLTICSNKITSKNIANLVELSQLTSLSVESDQIDDSALVSIGRLRQLTYLDLKSPNLTDKGIRHLERLDSLATIKIKSASLTSGEIWRLKSLRDVTLDSCQMSPIAYAGLAKCRMLTSLWIEGMTVPESEARCIGDLKELRSITLVDTGISNQSFRSLCGSAWIQTVRLDNVRPLTWDGLAVLDKCPIGKLEVNGLGHDDKCIGQVTNMPMLQSLKITLSTVDDDDLLALSRLQKLRSLVLSSADISDEQVSLLKMRLPATCVVIEKVKIK